MSTVLSSCTLFEKVCLNNSTISSPSISISTEGESDWLSTLFAGVNLRTLWLFVFAMTDYWDGFSTIKSRGRFSRACSIEATEFRVDDKFAPLPPLRLEEVPYREPGTGRFIVLDVLLSEALNSSMREGLGFTKERPWLPSKIDACLKGDFAEF